ncbi:diaminopimelate epimerase [Pseudomonadota bacterium]|jgi:diaminopimelate epimerase|nr:diaminopimelate epimerase [Pseudomonadota bacterium]
MLKFKKMHGNGNDFIIIENLTQMHALSKSQIIKMGDRKKGLGFDQLITINPPINSQHDFYVKFYNSDGSEADMCMNGVRSVGAFLWEAQLAPKKSLLLGTKSKPVLIKPTGSKKVKIILDYPVQKEVSKAEAQFLDKCGLKRYKFIDAGNKHLIIETKKVFSFDLDGLALKLRKRNFLKDVNISLFSKHSEKLELRTNEAGAGETLSCGSASAATASFNINDGLPLRIISAGGQLSLRKINDKLEMTGPAEFICEGTWLKN